LEGRFASAKCETNKIDIGYI